MPGIRLRLSVAGLIGLLILALPVRAQSGRTPAPARNGMVVTSHYLGSEVGRDILKKGGNAVDAAVATAFALAVVYPAAGNVGGGGFIVYHGADGYTTSFNFREKAPLAATETLYLGPDGLVRDDSNHEGPLAVGVPGTVAGLWLAHQRMGTLPWKDLVEPAVRLAAEGFPSTWYMQGWLREMRRAAHPMYAGTRRAFLKNGSEVYEPGETFRQPDLARTLERIRDHGKDGFYQGETARLLATWMKQHGGLITEEDLAAYKAVEQPPIHGSYHGYDVYSMAPPSSGGVGIVEMLNILEAFDLSAMGHNSALYMHVLTEAMRRSYSDRALHLGDPDFNPGIPVERLTSKEYAARLRSTIDLSRPSASDSSRFSSAYLPYESEETTHFSIVDPAGNAVSMTYTLEYGYGSGLVAEGTGFLLNNEMGDFNAVPGVTLTDGQIGTAPNLVAPGKRMLSSMTPTIVAKDDKPWLVIGTPGGRTIINTTLQVILNMVHHGMTVGEAVQAPRFHHQWLPDYTRVEDYGFSPDTIRLYEMMGHTVRWSGKYGSASGIWVDPDSGIRYGASDARDFDSRAVGF